MLKIRIAAILLTLVAGLFTSAAMADPAQTPANPDGAELGDVGQLDDFGAISQPFDVPANLLSGPAGDDVSYQMIQRLFGEPARTIHDFFFDGTTTGGGSGSSAGTALASLIKIVAYVALLYGLGMSSYVLVVGTVKTAQSGEFLGKWDSAFLPVRLGLGALSIFPNPVLGGLSFAQALGLAVAFLGIGMASAVSGVVYESVLRQPLTTWASSPGDIANVATSMIRSQVCQLLREKQGMAPAGSLPASMAGMMTAYNAGPGMVTQQQGYSSERFDIDDAFVHRISIGEDGDCGEMTFAYPTDFADGSLEQQAAQGTYGAYVGALNALWVDVLTSISNPIVNNQLVSEIDFEIARSRLAFAVNAYEQTLANASSEALSQAQQPALDEINEAIKAGGWVMMGGYYFLIESRQQRLNAAVTGSVGTFEGYDADYGVPGSQPEIQAALAAIETVAWRRMSPESNLRYMNSLATRSGTSDVFNDGSATRNQFESITGEINRRINTSIRDAITAGVGSNSGNISPMLMMRTVGTSIINVLTAVAVGSWVVRLFSDDDDESQSPSSGIGSTLLDTMVMIALTAGILLGFVVPTLPFIMWMTAAALHMLYVLESLVATPFWAANHMAPDGGDLTGRGGSGWVIMVTLFLTPLLMIVGFVAGMALLHVLGWLIHEMVIEGYLLTRAGSLGSPFSLVMPLLLYAFLMLYVTYRCLALTHELRNAFLRWIGAGDEHNLGESDIRTQFVALGGNLQRYIPVGRR